MYYYFLFDSINGIPISFFPNSKADKPGANGGVFWLFFFYFHPNITILERDYLSVSFY